MRASIFITPTYLLNMTLEHKLWEWGLRNRPHFIAQASLELLATLLSSSSGGRRQVQV